MIGKLSNSRIKPQALGVTSNSSTYGQTIPVIYGRTAGALYLIWCANVRPGPSAKKGKGGGSKKGKGAVTTYVANADCLIGTNPIAAILECWDNNNAKLGLNFVEYSAPAASSVTIPDSMFYCLLAVTCTTEYDVTFNDCGAGGSAQNSGSYEVPLWNLAYSRPNPAADFDPLPYFYRWTPASGPTINFEYTNLPGSTLNFYYTAMLPGGTRSQDRAPTAASPSRDPLRSPRCGSPSRASSVRARSSTATIQTATRTTCSRSFIRITRASVRPISILARAG